MKSQTLTSFFISVQCNMLSLQVTRVCADREVCATCAQLCVLTDWTSDSRPWPDLRNLKSQQIEKTLWTLKNVITSESKETAAVFYMNICSTGLKYMYSGAVLKCNSYIGLLVLFLLTSFLLCSLILLQYYYFTMLTVLFAPIATIMWH